MVCMHFPLLFTIILEEVMALAADQSREWVTISGQTIFNLRFADEIAVLSESEEGLRRLINNIQNLSIKLGLQKQHQEDRGSENSSTPRSGYGDDWRRTLESSETFVFVGWPAEQSPA